MSPMNTPMDHGDVVEFLSSLKKRERPLALLYVNPPSDQEFLTGGYVEIITEQLLGIETFHELHIMILLKVAPWFSINPSDAPAALKAIVDESYNFGMQVKAETWQCCVLGSRIAPE